MDTIAPPRQRKPPVDPATLTYRNLREGEFWRAIPAYANVDEATFLDHIWPRRTRSPSSINRSCFTPQP